MLAGDDVDNTGNRIGAVDGRGAIGQNLDAVDDHQRDLTQVDEVIGAAQADGIDRQPLAVHQHQGAAIAETAQVDTGCPGGKAEGKARVDRATEVLRQGVQHLLNRQKALLLDVVCLDDEDRGCPFDINPFDMRAGDPFLFQLDRVLLCGEADAANNDATGDDTAQRQPDGSPEPVVLLCHIDSPLGRNCSMCCGRTSPRAMPGRF